MTFLYAMTGPVHSSNIITIWGVLHCCHYWTLVIQPWCQPSPYARYPFHHCVSGPCLSAPKAELKLLTLLLSELRRIHRNSILNRFLLKTSFHCLLSFTFVTFLIHWSLSPAASIISWCRSYFVSSGLTYEIYIGCGPFMYIYYMVSYHGPYVRSVVVSLHTIALLMTIQNALWTMRLLSLHYWCSALLADLSEHHRWSLCDFVICFQTLAGMT